MKTNTYCLFKKLHDIEFQELKKAVKDFGGYVHFGDKESCKDYDCDENCLTNTEYPVVAANVSKWEEGPQDVRILSCLIDKDGRLIIWAEPMEAFYGEFELDYHDIEFGHISFITDLIPDKNDKVEPSYIQVASIVTMSGELVNVYTIDKTWEYGKNTDMDVTLSGAFITDERHPNTIIGFGGPDNPPNAVIDVLKRLGYVFD